MILKLCSIVLLTVIISSCGILGTKYVKPAITTPNKWQNTDNWTLVDESSNLSNQAWWNKFHNKELDYLIDVALKNNATLQQSIGNIIQAKANLQKINLSWIPNMSLAASYNSTIPLNSNNNSIPNSGGINGSASSQIGEMYSMGVLPTYSLNILSQIKTHEVAKNSLLVAQYTKDGIRLAIISQVVNAYFSLLWQKYQLQLLHSIIANNKQQKELAVTQYDNGLISLFVLQSIKQQYYNNLAQIPLIENNIAQSKNTLSVLLNEQPKITSHYNFININTSNIISINLPATILQYRPDVAQAEANLKQANAGIGVATSNYFPSINLNTAIGSTSAGLSGLFSSGTDFWQQQMNIIFPFLNLSYLSTIKGAKGVYYTAYYNYVLTVKQAFANVENSLSQHQKSAEHYNIMQQQLQAGTISMHLSQRRYEAGLDSYFNYLSYKINYDNSRIQLANSKMQQLLAITQLYQAMAGGYNVNNTEQAIKFNDNHDS